MKYDTEVTNKKNPKILKVHSPRVRVIRDDALNNRAKNMATTIADNMDYSKDKAFYEPQPGQRGDYRGQEIARRHRNTQMDKILDPSKAPPQPDAPPPGRCTTDLSRSYQQRNWAGTQPVRSEFQGGPARCIGDAALENQKRDRGSMSGIISQSRARAPSPPANPRVRQGAEENYTRARGGAMSATMNVSDNIKSGYLDSRPAPRCPNEASREQRERHQGVMGKAMAGQLAGDPVHAPRLGLGAADNAGREGSALSQNIGQYGKAPLDAQPKQRLGIGAAQNANQGRGSLTDQQYNYRKMAVDPQPAPRVRPEANEIARSQQGTVTKNLFQKYGKLPGEMQPKARVHSGAYRISKLSKGGGAADCMNPVRDYEKRRKKYSRRVNSAIY